LRQETVYSNLGLQQTLVIITFLLVSQGQNVHYKNKKCQLSSLTMAFIKYFCSMSTENMFAL